jgi:hypothetical protein
MSLNLTLVSTYNNLNFKPSTDQWLLNKEEIQLTEVAINLDSLKTGWGLLAPAMAPDWVWDNVTGRPDPQPTPEYKRAFSIEIIAALNGTMDWSGTGHGSCAAIETIFDEINKTRGDNPNKVPVFKYTRSDAKKVGKGNTRIPKFEFVGWFAPDALPWMQEKYDDFGDSIAHQSITSSISVDENMPF